jgi:hypothetical protein
MMFILKQKKRILGGTTDLPKKALKLEPCQKGLQTHKLILELGFN